jgi:hypothetical protein
MYRRIGMAGYARILGALKEPMTTAELMARCNVGKGAANRFVAAHHKRGRIRIVDWSMGHRKAPLPVWLAGAGPDAPYPTKRPNGDAVRAPKSERVHRAIWSELRAFLDFLDALGDGHSTCEELRADTGLTIISVRRLVRVLRETKQIRIASWVRPASGGRAVAAYTLGHGPSAPKPALRTRQQSNAAYRQRRAMAPTLPLLQRAWAANSDSLSQRA